MSQKIIDILKDINNELINKESMLTVLDNKIGDGDHGSNMKRGFSYAIQALEQENHSDIKSNFTSLGKTLLSKVGGASGPLYGMAFIKGSNNISGSKLTYDVLRQFVNDGADAIQKLGKAKIGDKTMYELWRKLGDDLNNNVDAKTLLENILIYRDQTKNEIAIKGRASYLKERSIGTVDPGCCSSEIIFRHLIGGLE